MSDPSWPGGWTVWSESEQKVVVAYRPGVFDSQAFPAPCLPTLYVSKGPRRRLPGDRTRADDPWIVTLFLEPEVDREIDRYDSRAAAIDAARESAREFDAGEIDYRSMYQVPRDAYLDRLDELTGPDE